MKLKLDYTLIRNGLFSFSIAFIVGASLRLASAWSPNANIDQGYPDFYDALVLIIGLILVAPLVETMILFCIFKFFNLGISRNKAAPLAGLFLASLHAIKGYEVAVIVLLSFQILAHPFSVKLKSSKQAFHDSLYMHVVHNTAAFIVIILLGGVDGVG